MPHIMIICTANICRSPVAEAILRTRLHERGLTGWVVSSAGTWAEMERGAATYSIQVATRRGLDLRSHRSRMVTEASLAEADLVLCMEIGHVEALRAEFPAHASKVYLLAEIAGKYHSISDPYGGSVEAYERMINELLVLLDEGLPNIIRLAETNAYARQGER